MDSAPPTNVSGASYLASGYEDFDLEISPGSGRQYTLHVRSRAGEQRVELHFPFDELVLENRLQAVQIALLRGGGVRRRTPSAEEMAVQHFGQALFEALFAADVRSLYDSSLRMATNAGRSLQLKLNIHAPELAALPWEFLYDPRQGEYLALSLRTPIVRSFDLPQPIIPLPVTAPLRILGLVAAPHDLPALDVAREKERVERAVHGLASRGLVELVWVEGQSWRDLRDAMRRGPWHILHFIGHGGYNTATDEGFLALADEQGRMAPLPAQHLARLLADHAPLRLVLLNACSGAEGSSKDLFAGTAATLVRRNIPAVVAMQYEITDRAAIEFSHSFYEAVANGMSLAAALSEARIAMSVAVANSVEWGAPVLYRRGPDGVLFVVGPPTPIPPLKPAPAVQASEPPSSPADEPVDSVREADAKTGRPDIPLTKYATWIGAALALLVLGAVWLFYPQALPWLLGSAWSPSVTITPAPSATQPAEVAETLDPATTTPTSLPTPIASIVAVDPARLNDCQNLLDEDDWEAALACYDSVLADDPENVAANVGRGVALQMGDQFEEAIVELSSAIELDPDSADAFFQRGYTNYRLGAKLEKEGDSGASYYEQGMADLERAIELAPDVALYYAKRGELAWALGDPQRALADFNQSLSMDPELYVAYLMRGDLYTEQLEQPDLALADYSRAIELRPQEAYPYFVRAQVFRKMEDLPAAAEDYQRFLDRAHPDSDAYGLEEAEKFLADHPLAQTPQTGARVTPPVAAIDVDNASAVRELGRLGRGTLTHMAMSQGGELFAVGSSFGVYLYAADNWATQHFFATDEEAQTIALCDQGVLLAAGEGSTIHLWEIETGNELPAPEGTGNRITDLAFSSCEDLLAVADSDGNVTIWSIADEEIRAQLPVQDSPVQGLAFSPDGALLATASESNLVQLWRSEDGTPAQSLEHGEDAGSVVTFSPDGHWLAASGATNSGSLWAVDTGQLNRRDSLEIGAVQTLRFSPDSTLLAVGTNQNSVYVLEVPSMAGVAELKDVLGEVRDVTFTPEGDRLFVATEDGFLNIYAAKNWQRMQILDGHLSWAQYRVLFSPNGELLAAAGGNAVRIWSTALFQRVATLPEQKGQVSDLAFAPESDRLAVATHWDHLRRWDISTVQERAAQSLGALDAGGVRVAYAPDGALVVGDNKGLLRLIPAGDTQPTQEVAAHDGEIMAMAITPQGDQLLTAARDNLIKLWGFPALEPQHTIQVDATPNTLAVSPDGARFAGGGADGVFIIRSLPDGETLDQRQPSDEQILAVAYAPDTDLLATAGVDDLIRLWQASDLTLLAELAGHRCDVYSIAFSPDGKLLASSSCDGTVRLWGVWE
jgi:WD40 repeat protein/tetratricopeptide (TPR) repeat protein